MKLALCAAAGLVLGYVLGCYAPATGLTEGSGKGDISKVSKYSKNVVSPYMSAFQEKILNDSTEMKKTAASLTILNNRMSDFNKLVEIAVEASDGVEQLSSSVSNLQNVSTLAKNAKLASEQALDSFNAMCNGDAKQAPNQYETASQNLALAYLMVERQISVGKEFVCDVDSYLRDKKIEDNMDLAMARDLWVGYCACESVLSNDSEALEYWKSKKAVVNEDVLGAYTLVCDQEKFRVASEIMGNQELIVASLNQNPEDFRVLSNNDEMAVLSNIGDLASPDIVRAFEDLSSVSRMNNTEFSDATLKSSTDLESAKLALETEMVISNSPVDDLVRTALGDFEVLGILKKIK